MWEQKLKQYDNKLYSKKNLDGSIIIYRRSPFNSSISFNILTITNQYPGNWIIRKLMLMDTQRRDLVGASMRNNMSIRNQKDDDRITREIVEVFQTGGDIFVN